MFPYGNVFVPFQFGEGPGTPSFRLKVTWVISPVRLWEKAQFELTAALSTSARLVAIHQKSLR
jgi:hypothetical protein